MLPHEILETIHNIFGIMWATRITPASWKTSYTTHRQENRGAETDTSSYRPIGLANTLYNLWKCIVTNTFYNFGEAHSLLSTTQAGFCNQKGARHQLQNHHHDHEPWGCEALWKWHLCPYCWLYNLRHHRAWQNALDHVQPWFPNWCRWYCQKPVWRCHHAGQGTLQGKRPGNTSLEEAPSKVIHSLPSSSFFTWNLFYDGSVWEDAASDTRAS